MMEVSHHSLDRNLILKENPSSTVSSKNSVTIWQNDSNGCAQYETIQLNLLQDSTLM